MDKWVIITTGGRNYDDTLKVEKVIAALVLVHGAGNLIIRHGDCRGADKLVDRWARRYGIEVDPHPAQWKREDGTTDYNAGKARNEEMMTMEPKPNLCIAFKGGAGTAHAVRRAKAHNIPVAMV